MQRECGVYLTLHVPGDMAVHGPDARVVGQEPDDDVRLCRHGDGVAAHRVLEVPRRVALAELALAPAYDLETVPCSGEWLVSLTWFSYEIFSPHHQHH